MATDFKKFARSTQPIGRNPEGMGSGSGKGDEKSKALAASKAFRDLIDSKNISSLSLFDSVESELKKHIDPSEAVLLTKAISAFQQGGAALYSALRQIDAKSREGRK